MTGGDAAARGAIWEHLTRLSAAGIDRAFRMVELVIGATLERPHPYITLGQTEALLRRALTAGSTDTREAATCLVHTLGQRGYIEFGQLLGSE
jgi:hypothetical protein